MLEKPYEGFATFFKADIGHHERPVHIIGVPYDGSNSGRPGARHAPAAIRDASKFLTDGAHPVFEVDPALFATDLGDVNLSNCNVSSSMGEITRHIMASLNEEEADSRLLTALVGGDHTITLASLRAFSKKYAGIKVIHFDAHCDTWKDHFGDPIGHGTWVRNALTEGLFDATDILQIGLRSPVDPETRMWLPKLGGTVITTKEARTCGVAEIVRFIRSVAASSPVYLTVDIDVLDPSAAPGTGTPEVGGLPSAFLLDILDEIGGLNIVGMDVVEVSPAYDHSQITALAAAQILYTVICSRIAAQDWFKPKDYPACFGASSKNR